MFQDHNFNFVLCRRYRNAEQDDLWRFMTQQAHADGVLDVNMDVKSIMDTWTLQMGFPLITITRDYGKQSISMQQVPNLLIKSVKVDG